MHRIRNVQRLVALGVVTLAGVIPMSANAASARKATTRATAVGNTESQTFSYTGTAQTFQVPPGVSAVQIVATGAAGGLSGVPSNSTFPASPPAGAGGWVYANLSVSPGEILDIYAGQAGGNANADWAQVGAGGSASGASAGGGAGGAYGNQAGGGGGATLVTTTAGIDGGVLVAAGGGGGAGASCGLTPGGFGGDGGSPAQNGQTVYIPNDQSPGGVGGGAPTPVGTDGANGRIDASAEPYGCGAGGGGGGFPNGGGGGQSSLSTNGGGVNGNGPGGGGGDSYVTPSAYSSSFSTSALSNGSVTITWTEPVTPAVTLSASKLQAGAGSPVTLRANVNVPTGDPAPSGKVEFYDQYTGGQVGTAQLSAANPGVATLTTHSLPRGTNGYYAAYIGDGNYLEADSGEIYVNIGPPSVGTVPTQPVTPDVTLTFSKTSVSKGTSVILTADVIPPIGDIAPTGEVQFYNQYTGALLGTAQLSTSNPGVAILTTHSLDEGGNAYYAAYIGDSHYSENDSADTFATVYDRTVSVLKSTLNFGPVTAGTERALAAKITNNGADPVTFANESVNGQAFTISGSTCNGATIDAGQTCDVLVVFQPPAAGTYTGSLLLNDNATTDKGTQKVNLTGTGT